MYKGNSFLGIIPARGGSKGIPNKNIIRINRRPLIDYTIKEALGSKYLDKIIVTTDSKEISKISKNCGAEVPFLRPKHLAQDESNIIDAVIYTINILAEKNQTYDYLVLLQPTQPLRKSFHIDEAIELIIEKEADSLVSITKVREHPVLMRTIDKKGRLNNLINMGSTIRRQDLPDYFKVNGSIYINKIDKNFNIKTSFNDNKLPYIMDRRYDLDIDEPEDLKLFKIKLEI